MGFPLWCRYTSLFISFALLLTINLSYGHNHDHDHDHHHHDSHHHHHDEVDERPSFKYSREANQDVSPEKLTKIDSGHSHLHHHDESHDHHAKPSHGESANTVVKRDASEVWFYALASTVTISVVPFFILWFIPLDNSAEYQPFLKILLSFASGGLLGDAFLHLIPHALIAQQARESASEGHHHGHGHGHGHGHSHESDGEHHHSHDMSVGLWVLAGVLAFLVVEKFVRICKGPGHGHSHSVSHKTSASPKSQDKKKVKSKEDETKKQPEQVEQIKVAGYLNLAADMAHNLTDGLAIGASFITGQGIGFMTTITILFHEIPHEIGDFAILIQSGCSRKKAMFLQLLTALGAVTGTLISLVADGTSETASPWILPFTAGGFIYIACVSVIPELLEETNLKQSILEIIAAAIGVLIMVFIAQFE
ncbi:protein catecholamines up isoform X2 [Tetranychus urticae]|uniref:Uncharacterized protein n=1 Tax=Tetranychus urticae TaxID=32264 RepID=T1K1L2_TETUR|nr:protein catecholamines up isoform X2 [Tetranychus urticae]